MTFPIDKDAYGNEISPALTRETYDALTAAQARTYGFLQHPAVVYERVEDKISTGLDGRKEMTIDPVVDDPDHAGFKKKVPVETTLHGLKEGHYTFSDVKVGVTVPEV